MINRSFPNNQSFSFLNNQPLPPNKPPRVSTFLFFLTLLIVALLFYGFYRFYHCYLDPPISTDLPDQPLLKPTQITDPVLRPMAERPHQYNQITYQLLKPTHTNNQTNNSQYLLQIKIPLDQVQSIFRQIQKDRKKFQFLREIKKKEKFNQTAERLDQSTANDAEIRDFDEDPIFDQVGLTTEQLFQKDTGGTFEFGPLRERSTLSELERLESSEALFTSQKDANNFYQLMDVLNLNLMINQFKVKKNLTERSATIELPLRRTTKSDNQTTILEFQSPPYLPVETQINLKFEVRSVKQEIVISYQGQPSILIPIQQAK